MFVRLLFDRFNFFRFNWRLSHRYLLLFILNSIKHGSRHCFGRWHFYRRNYRLYRHQLLFWVRIKFAKFFNVFNTFRKLHYFRRSYFFLNRFWLMGLLILFGVLLRCFLHFLNFLFQYSNLVIFPLNCHNFLFLLFLSDRFKLVLSHL